MIVLHKLAPAWGLPDISPFVIKVETYLRLTGVPFEARFGDPRKAPKRKLPIIEHEGRVIADSRFILEHLEARSPKPLDADLGARERATATAFQSMIEEHFYFVMAYVRWKNDEGWAITEPVMKKLLASGSVPGPLLGVAARQIRRQHLKRLDAQGTGRHSRDEVDRIGARIIGAVATELDARPFFLGEEPRTIDATVYAFMMVLLDGPFDGALKQQAAGHANLRAYVDRIKARAYA